MEESGATNSDSPLQVIDEVEASCDDCSKWQSSMENVLQQIDLINKVNTRVNDAHVSSLHTKMDKILVEIDKLKEKQDSILKHISDVVKQNGGLLPGETRPPSVEVIQQQPQPVESIGNVSSKHQVTATAPLKSGGVCAVVEESVNAMKDIQNSVAGCAQQIDDVLPGANRRLPSPPRTSTFSKNEEELNDQSATHLLPSSPSVFKNKTSKKLSTAESVTDIDNKENVLMEVERVKTEMMAVQGSNNSSSPVKKSPLVNNIKSERSSTIGNNNSKLAWAEGCIILGDRSLHDSITLNHDTRSLVSNLQTQAKKFKLSPIRIESIERTFDCGRNIPLIPLPTSEAGFDKLVLAVGHQDLISGVSLGHLITLQDASLDVVRNKNAPHLKKLAEHLVKLFKHLLCQEPKLGSNIKSAGGTVVSGPVSQFLWSRVIFVMPVHPPTDKLEVFKQFEELFIEVAAQSLAPYSNFKLVNMPNIMRSADEDYVNKWIVPPKDGKPTRLSEVGSWKMFQSLRAALESEPYSSEFGVLKEGVKFCFRCIKNHPGGGEHCKSLSRGCRKCGEAGHFHDIHDITDTTLQGIVRQHLGSTVKFNTEIEKEKQMKQEEEKEREELRRREEEELSNKDIVDGNCVVSSNDEQRRDQHSPPVEYVEESNTPRKFITQFSQQQQQPHSATKNTVAKIQSARGDSQQAHRNPFFQKQQQQRGGSQESGGGRSRGGSGSPYDENIPPPSSMNGASSDIGDLTNNPYIPSNNKRQRMTPRGGVGHDYPAMSRHQRHSISPGRMNDRDGGGGGGHLDRVMEPDMHNRSMPLGDKGWVPPRRPSREDFNQHSPMINSFHNRDGPHHNQFRDEHTPNFPGRGRRGPRTPPPEDNINDNLMRNRNEPPRMVSPPVGMVPPPNHHHPHAVNNGGGRSFSPHDFGRKDGGRGGGPPPPPEYMRTHHQHGGGGMINGRRHSGDPRDDDGMRRREGHSPSPYGMNNHHQGRMMAPPPFHGGVGVPPPIDMAGPINRGREPHHFGGPPPSGPSPSHQHGGPPPMGGVGMPLPIAVHGGGGDGRRVEVPQGDSSMDDWYN